jgi:hypothetical protein
MKREESQTIEYKASWHEKYLEWICGYANAKGELAVRIHGRTACCSR